MILRRVSFFEAKIRISRRKRNQIKNILTHWSVAQASLNYKKKLGIFFAEKIYILMVAHTDESRVGMATHNQPKN